MSEQNKFNKKKLKCKFTFAELDLSDSEPVEKIPKTNVHPVFQNILDSFKIKAQVEVKDESSTN